MFKTTRNLVIVSSFFVVALVLSNVLAAKVVQIGPVELPADVIAYSITFLMADVVSEIWGRKEAHILVGVGFAMQVFSLLLITIAVLLPAAPYTDQEAFSGVLGQTWRIVIAAMAAYLVSQTFDVFAFHKVKKHFKAKWLRNSTTVVSQLIDTSIFITIAFLGSVPSILVMILSQYVAKVCFALADTPFFYLLTRHGSAENREQYLAMKNAEKPDAE